MLIEVVSFKRTLRTGRAVSPGADKTCGEESEKHKHCTQRHKNSS